MPALKQKAIGTSDVLPVLMRVYTNWVGELRRLVAEALLERGIDCRGTTCRAPTHLVSEALILKELRQGESRNLRTVLIFDQFEEFFFVYPNPTERRRFFEFVGECLNILRVKVILSLREDYLHYLLECDRLPSMKIIGNDILTANVRYSLGNFSAEDAKAIVQRLTEQSYFHLEPALIEQLVRDLAGNEGEVRPIELQIVGAQLQAENITKLAEYQACGRKEELVERYLAEVVKDCGAENEQVAELVLYLLTDEKGTRPLKTRAELERDLQTFAADSTVEASRLDLVLQIFVDSGLVVLLPELPADRYQLVHDYIATFIRQQQEPRLKELMVELEKEREQRKLGEEKLNRFLKRALIGSVAAGCVFAVLAVAAGVSAWRAEQQTQLAQQQRQRAEVNEINALTNSSEALFLSERTFDSLIEALKVRGKLKKAGWASVDTQIRAKATLLQAVYDLREPNSSQVSQIRERNRLEGHSNYVYSVSFSPDGQTLASASYDHTVKLWNFDFESLQAEGCHWLKDYLVTHPRDLETLEVCQNLSILMAAAPFLVKEGEEPARQGNVKDAVATFRQALKWNPNLTLNPEAKAQQLAKASALVKQGKKLLQEKQFKEAAAAYTEAQKLDANVDIADSWNTLCWDGSLQGYAKQAMFACEKAVALAPDDGNYRDSRGLARALTGNTQGAIADFQAYIAQTDDKEEKSRRQRWIDTLRAGKNPFTPEEIKKLH